METLDGIYLNVSECDVCWIVVIPVFVRPKAVPVPPILQQNINFKQNPFSHSTSKCKNKAKRVKNTLSNYKKSKPLKLKRVAQFLYIKNILIKALNNPFQNSVASLTVIAGRLLFLLSLKC